MLKNKLHILKINQGNNYSNYNIGDYEYFPEYGEIYEVVSKDDYYRVPSKMTSCSMCDYTQTMVFYFTYDRFEKIVTKNNKLNKAIYKNKIHEGLEDYLVVNI